MPQTTIDFYLSQLRSAAMNLPLSIAKGFYLLNGLTSKKISKTTFRLSIPRVLARYFYLLVDLLMKLQQKRLKIQFEDDDNSEIQKNIMSITNEITDVN